MQKKSNLLVPQTVMDVSLIHASVLSLIFWLILHKVTLFKYVNEIAKLDYMKVGKEVKLNYSKSFHYAFPLIKIPVSV